MRHPVTSGIWTIRVSPSLQVLEAWHDAKNHGRKPGFRCFDVDGNLVWVVDGTQPQSHAEVLAIGAAEGIQHRGRWGDSEALRREAV